jgi:hypothetical protein
VFFTRILTTAHIQISIIKVKVARQLICSRLAIEATIATPLRIRQESDRHTLVP